METVNRLEVRSTARAKTVRPWSIPPALTLITCPCPRMSFTARNLNRDFKAAISMCSIKSNFTSLGEKFLIMFEIRHGAKKSIKQLRISH
jgi:hypothetical protein